MSRNAAWRTTTVQQKNRDAQKNCAASRCKMVAVGDLRLASPLTRRQRSSIADLFFDWSASIAQGPKQLPRLSQCICQKAACTAYKVVSLMWTEGIASRPGNGARCDSQIPGDKRWWSCAWLGHNSDQKRRMQFKSNISMAGSIART